jgi:hypothetical protein
MNPDPLLGETIPQRLRRGLDMRERQQLTARRAFALYSAPAMVAFALTIWGLSKLAACATPPGRTDTAQVRLSVEARRLRRAAEEYQRMKFSECVRNVVVLPVDLAKPANRSFLNLKFVLSTDGVRYTICR